MQPFLQNAPAPAEPPEPAEPQVIGVTEESTVEEVLDVLRGFQESTLRSPFSRAEFVEGLDDFMSEALRHVPIRTFHVSHDLQVTNQLLATPRY